MVVKCGICGEVGHNKRGCRKGAKPAAEQKGETRSQVGIAALVELRDEHLEIVKKLDEAIELLRGRK